MSGIKMSGVIPLQYKGYKIIEINLTTYEVWQENRYWFTTNHLETAKEIIDRMVD